MKNKKSLLDRFVDTMAAIFVPALPVITAAGILKAFILLAAAIGILNEAGDTYFCLNFISNAGFAFLPLVLAHSASAHFGGTPYLGLMAAAALFHASYVQAVDTNTALTIFTINVALKNYASAIVPGILVGMTEAYAERLFKKIIPHMVSFILVPALSILVTGPLALLVVGPLGMYVGDLLGMLVEFIYVTIGWPAVAVLAGLCPAIVSAGVSLCLIPLSLTAIANVGFDAFTRPAFLACNLAIAGASMAVSVKSKIRENKHLTLQTSIIAMMGITEPSLYGSLIPMKKPFLAASLAAAIGGAFAGLTNVKGVAYASPSILTLPIFLGDTFVYAVLTCAVSFAAGFLLTWLLGFSDERLAAAGRDPASITGKD